MKTIITTTAVLGLLASNSVMAANLTGAFVDLGSNVWTFEVTNTAGNADVGGLDFGGAVGIGDGGFSGSFLNTGADTNFDFVPDTAITFTPDVDGLPVAETYFAFSAAGLLTVNIEDTINGAGTSLEGAFAYNPTSVMIASGQTRVVAVFTTQGEMPTFLGGTASFIGGGSADIVVPEPSSLALLGLGGLAMLRRRRA